MSANPDSAQPSALNGSAQEIVDSIERYDPQLVTETADAPHGVGRGAPKDRGAKSSSPLSQFEVEEEPGEVSDMDMDEDDNDYENDEAGRQADQTDRISDSTVQPRRSPEQAPTRTMVDASEHDAEHGIEDDDDADERQSSVTSSTIPLTSLDDSPNHRYHGPEAPTSTSHTAVPKTLGVPTSSNSASHSDPKLSVLAESSTLSSVTDPSKPSNGAENLPHSRDDDGSDLTSDDEDLDISEDDGDDEEMVDELDEEGDDGFTDVFSDSDEEREGEKGRKDLHVP